MAAARKRQREEGRGRYAGADNPEEAKKALEDTAKKANDYHAAQVELLKSINKHLDIIERVTIGGSGYGDDVLSPVNMSGAARVRVDKMGGILNGLSLNAISKMQGRR